jgi:hypothetical protein
VHQYVRLHIHCLLLGLKMFWSTGPMHGMSLSGGAQLTGMSTVRYRSALWA